MSSESLIIADAVAEKLRAWEYSEAKRRLLVVFQHRDLQQRRITVVPVGFESEMQSRNSDKLTVLVQIGIQQLLRGQNPDAEIEALINVERDIMRRFNRMVNLSTLNGKVVAIENNPLFDGRAVQESNLFIGIITLSVEISVTAEVPQ